MRGINRANLPIRRDDAAEADARRIAALGRGPRGAHENAL